MILGLDASTTTCGWAIVDSSILIAGGFFNLTKLFTIREKVTFVVDQLRNIPYISEITHINVEAALLGFTNKSSQQTIIKLIKFNSILQYVLEDAFSVPVLDINVSTARKKVFGKARVTGMEAKKYVKSMIPKVVPNIADFDILNNRGAWNSKNSDMYDAIVLALYGYNSLHSS